MRKENRVRTLLMLLSLFCCMLECARIYQSGRIIYVFLLWNLFLAWVPYIIGTYLTTPKKIQFGYTAMVCVFGLVVILPQYHILDE